MQLLTARSFFHIAKKIHFFTVRYNAAVLLQVIISKEKTYRLFNIKYVFFLRFQVHFIMNPRWDRLILRYVSLCHEYIHNVIGLISIIYPTNCTSLGRKVE